MRKFDLNFKRKVVQDYLSGKGGYQTTVGVVAFRDYSV